MFLLKMVLSSSIIAFTSWLAGRKPVFAGFIVSLPLVSMLSIAFAYREHRDMEKINQFAMSILVLVPLSLTFFIPFVLNRWLKMGFLTTFVSSLVCLAVAYAFATFVLKIDLTK